MRNHFFQSHTEGKSSEKKVETGRTIDDLERVIQSENYEETKVKLGKAQKVFGQHFHPAF